MAIVAHGYLAGPRGRCRALTALEAMGSRLTILNPAEDEAMLEEAGFGDITLFYAALTFLGWIGYA